MPDRALLRVTLRTPITLVIAGVLCGCEALFVVDPPSSSGPCTTNRDCATGQVCDTSACRDPCMTVHDCDPGQSCVALPTGVAVCLVPCTYDNQCAGSEKCVALQCRRPSDGSTQVPDATMQGDADASADATVGPEATLEAEAGDSPGADADATVPIPDAHPEVGYGEGGDAEAGDAEAGDADVTDGDASGVDGCPGSISQLLLFGGSTGARVLGDTWAFGDGGWVELDDGSTPPPHLDAGPAARWSLAMGTVCGNAVMFGGTSLLNGLPPLGDQWIWSGNAWSPVGVGADGPPATTSASSAVWNDRWILFGGEVANGLSTNATWLFDGIAWSGPFDAPDGMAPRNMAAMASFGGGVLLVGGFDDMGDPLRDAWLWNGATWTRVQDPPLALGAASAAGLGGTVVVFGGYDDTSTYRRNTLVWNGAEWRDATLDSGMSPGPRISPAMGTLGNVVVLYGGSAPAVLSDTWIWGGASWTRYADGGAVGPPARYAAAITGSH
jgi:hypothetical protein